MRQTAFPFIKNLSTAGRGRWWERQVSSTPPPWVERQAGAVSRDCRLPTLLLHDQVERLGGIERGHLHLLLRVDRRSGKPRNLHLGAAGTWRVRHHLLVLCQFHCCLLLLFKQQLRTWKMCPARKPDRDSH